MGARAHPEPLVLQSSGCDRGDPEQPRHLGPDRDDVRRPARARRADLPESIRLLGHANRRFSDRFAAAAAGSSKPFLLSPLAGQAGAWLEEYRQDFGIAVGNGLRGSLRGLQTMSRFMRSRRDAAVNAPDSAPPVERPPGPTVMSDGEQMLTFADSMELLADVGYPDCTLRGRQPRRRPVDVARRAAGREARRRGAPHRARGRALRRGRARLCQRRCLR